MTGFYLKKQKGMVRSKFLLAILAQSKSEASKNTCKPATQLHTLPGNWEDLNSCASDLSVVYMSEAPVVML